MGIKKSAMDSVKSTLSDQWVDVITVGQFDEQTAVMPGIKKDHDDNEFKGVISNGSKIYVPENTAAVIFDQAGVEEIITEPGGYYYNRGQDSLFSWGTISEAIVDQTLERFRHAGTASDEKRISFINLREIRNIKFGTRGPILCHDSFYDADVEIIGFGSFSIKIVNPLSFIRNYLPPNSDRYSFEDIQAREQLGSEVLQDLTAGLGALQSQYKLSEMPTLINALSDYLSGESRNVRTWEERFGIKLVRIAIESLELSEQSKSMLKENAANRINEQADTLKKLKELLDEGILTQEEFEAKKKEVIGL